MPHACRVGPLQVVVTGLSTFTSLGHDPHTFFDNLCEGKCGIGPVTNFNCDGLTPQTTHQVHRPCTGMRPPPPCPAAAHPSLRCSGSLSPQLCRVGCPLGRAPN